MSTTRKAYSTPVPVSVPGESEAVQVASGSRHSLILTASGAVYGTGWNRCGQLGHGLDAHKREPVPVLIRALEGVKIVAVSAGGVQSAFVDDSGGLWMCGDNEYGTIGVGTPTPETRRVMTPRRVELPGGARVATVSCGGLHTLVLDDAGVVWAFGRCIDGQLGVGRSWLDAGEGCQGVALPTRVEGLEGHRVVAIGAGAFHSAVVTDAGRVFTFGKAEYGMLGHRTIEDEDSPRAVAALEGHDVVHVACGGWHTVCVTREGGVFVFGRGEYGRLGLGSDVAQAVPKMLPAFGPHCPVASVSAGGTHTVFLLRDGRLMACGRGEFGRCGDGRAVMQAEPVPVLLPSSLLPSQGPGATPQARAVSCGGAHSIALIAAGTGEAEAAS